MKISQGKSFIGTPFNIVAETIQNQPGIWDSEKVSIYRDNILVGEYLRNYGNGVGTFYPFQLEDQWYALYSVSYTALRVMRLNTDHIEDWCGEEPVAHGFCPMEIYVPRYHTMTDSVGVGDTIHEYEYSLVDNEVSVDEFTAEGLSVGCKGTQYCNFGFLGGCVWGDDSSMKLRYIDLKRVPFKELEITEKFGYWEIPNKMSVRSAVDMSNWEEAHHWIALSKMEHFNLKTEEIL
jgi:hypothetical protein